MLIQEAIFPDLKDEIVKEEPLQEEVKEIEEKPEETEVDKVVAAPRNKGGRPRKNY